MRKLEVGFNFGPFLAIPLIEVVLAEDEVAIGSEVVTVGQGDMAEDAREAVDMVNLIR